MKQTFLSFSVFILIVVISQSCYYDKAYLLSPAAQPCDTTLITFSEVIQPIFLQQCMDCHSTQNHSAGVILDTYAGSKIIADNGKLMGGIKHQSGFSFMPKNLPQLDPCTTRIIELWVQDGAPDN